MFENKEYYIKLMEESDKEEFYRYWEYEDIDDQIIDVY